jgi:hypothetical protein
MSIYATSLYLDADDHDEACTRWAPWPNDTPCPPGRCALIANGRTYVEDPTRPCTCGVGPIAYQQSHVLPADDDPRGGSFDLAEIPGFITRGDRKLTFADGEDPDYTERVWPWLRASVNGETVVLDRAQVARIHAYLGEWLVRSDGEA